MTLWAHTAECQQANTDRLGRGEYPKCQCGEPGGGGAGGRENVKDGTRDGDGTWWGGKWYPSERWPGESIAEYNQRTVGERLSAGYSQQDAYRDLRDADSTPPPDGTEEAGGYWLDGKWHPNDEQYHRLFRTHHDPGSAEEKFSRRMRFDKYLAMQQLLMAIASANLGTEIGEPDASVASGKSFQVRAAEILAGMVRPQNIEQRAADRATEIEALMVAYRVVQHVGPPGSVNYRAATITVEALKAWERAHPPAPLDPLLL